MNCYEAIDLMGDALAGILGLEARSGLDAHLEECPACGTYMEQLRLTCQALEHLPRPRGTSRQRSELIANFRSEFEKNG